MVKDSKMESNLPGELASCLRNEPINPQMFVNTVVMGAVCVLANMLSVFLSKRLEYRIIPGKFAAAILFYLPILLR